ncbi:hypothetical protein HYDPIDRAFT_112685 [Hydnomerulius pinastri MD-312]|uniref:Heterokaryon incompatibility domain-containing protein n=1 Tax=Hydnomerulius pinastri MD-312 TaxID=994086 RepID=A0A0C9W8G0_9AGAM|nr:hypothetical protein HYDPIDRAFT_112685 [Hydnomerulius pinastri MD-312]
MSTLTERHVHGRIDAYIQNILPMNMIYTSKMILVGRSAYKDYIRPAIKVMIATYDADPSHPWWTPEPKETVLQQAIEKAFAYAIFSHRWLLEGEVVYGDMFRYWRPRGQGWQKLKAFCDLARREYACTWAWADTCCIDKRSSAELEESIRSMYQWYSAAEVCVVYPADTKSEADLLNDAWFTRGWTLQELLAPGRIKFFNQRWEPLASTHNDRHDVELVNTISTITGIPVTDLISFGPGTDRVKDKMGWAAQRRTTRVEDAAYSLIGIFGVNLTVAYGEGTRAFFRLQMAIMERSNDTEILLWNGEPSHDNSMIAASAGSFLSDVTLEGDDLTRFLERSISYPRKPLANAVTKILIPRGGESVAMVNGRLRLEVVLYRVQRLTLDDGEREGGYTVHVEGLLDRNARLPDHVDQTFRLAVIDYERDDANGELTEQARTLLEPLPSMAKVLTCNVDSFDTGTLLQAVESARISRSYAAILLKPHLFDHHCYQRWADSDIIHVNRPPFGWMPPQTIFVV